MKTKRSGIGQGLDRTIESAKRQVGLGEAPLQLACYFDPRRQGRWNKGAIAGWLALIYSGATLGFRQGRLS